MAAHRMSSERRVETREAAIKLDATGIVRYTSGEGFLVRDPDMGPWQILAVDQAQALCKSIAREIGIRGEEVRSQWWYGSVTERILGLVVQVAPNLIGEDLVEVVAGKDRELAGQYEQAARLLGREVRAVKKFRRLEEIALGHLSQQNPLELSREFVAIGKAVRRSALVPGEVKFRVSQYLVEETLVKSVPARVRVTGPHRGRELSRVHGVLAGIIKALQPSLGGLVLTGEREPRQELPKAA